MNPQTDRRDGRDWRPWSTLGVAAVAGPFIGMFVVYAVVALFGSPENGTGGLWVLMFALHPLSWMLAFFLGGVPAVLAGAAYVVLDRYLGAVVPRLPLAAALGAATTFGFWVVASGNEAVWRQGWWLAGSGAVASGLVAHLTRRWRY